MVVQVDAGMLVGEVIMAVLGEMMGQVEVSVLVGEVLVAVLGLRWRWACWWERNLWWAWV